MLTPVKQAGACFASPEGWKAELAQVTCYLLDSQSSIHSSLSAHPHDAGQSSSYPQGCALSTYINRHDNIPRGFDAEVFAVQIPFLFPNQQHLSTEGNLYHFLFCLISQLFQIYSRFGQIPKGESLWISAAGFNRPDASPVANQYCSSTGL